MGGERQRHREEGTEVGHGGRAEQKSRGRGTMGGWKDDIKNKQKKKSGESKESEPGKRSAGVATQAPPPDPARAPGGRRKEAQTRGIGRIFIQVGRAPRSGRVQHQQLVHVRVQPVAALEGGQQPRALPEGRVVSQRQAPPRQRGGGALPGPPGGAEAARRPRDAVTAGPGPRQPPPVPPAPHGLIRSPVPAPSCGVARCLSSVPRLSLCGSLSLCSPGSKLPEYGDRV